MKVRRGFLIGAALLFTLGVAMVTTYLCLEHFVFSRRTAPQGVVAAHAWAHKIGLTPDQEEKLKPLDASLEKDLKGLQVKLAQERMALCTLLRDGTSDSKELDEYVARVGALESQQQRRVVQHLIVMREILTPDQKGKFFNAIMQDICLGCRMTIGDEKDMCGMCAIPKRRSQ